MISAVKWIPRGVAKLNPQHCEITEQEIERLKKLEPEENDIDMEPEEEEEKTTEKNKNKVPTETDEETQRVIKEFNLDYYDDDENGGEEDLEDVPVGIGKLTFYNSNQEDPYLVGQDEEDSDIENFAISPNDAIILSIKTTEDELSTLEVYIYEEEESNLFIHHDLMLPGYPLCLEWLDIAGGSYGSTKGNFCAVGTFLPAIEIWDLDIIDVLEPACALGGEISQQPEESSKKKKKKEKLKLKESSHTDAVLSLSWNKNQRNILASGSADTTAKVWDIANEKCLYTINPFNNKVQAVIWNPQEASVMVTGGFGGDVCLLDARQPNSSLKWKLPADVECIRWNPHAPQCFLVGTEDGMVTNHDARMAGETIFRLKAHDESTSCLALNVKIPNLMATCSVDQTVKLWDFTENKPNCVHSQELDLGALFSVDYCSESPSVLAIGGSKSKIRIWDSAEISFVQDKLQQSSNNTTENKK